MIRCKCLVADTFALAISLPPSDCIESLARSTSDRRFAVTSERSGRRPTTPIAPARSDVRSDDPPSSVTMPASIYTLSGFVPAMMLPTADRGHDQRFMPCRSQPATACPGAAPTALQSVAGHVGYQGGQVGVVGLDAIAVCTAALRVRLAHRSTLPDSSDTSARLRPYAP